MFVQSWEWSHREKKKTFYCKKKEGRLAGAMFWSKLEAVGFSLLVKGLTLGRSMSI